MDGFGLRRCLADFDLRLNHGVIFGKNGEAEYETSFRVFDCGNWIFADS